ncbi:MAG TPA: nitroreductase [Steroidobacteraceae bacterium]|jgi:nitroreductase|nr:nitroreductase [Steroidobacteraceae bacterium]
MQAIDALLERRSAKTLTDPAPDEGALALLLESASRAPDHGRLRPWRFIVIRSGARDRLGELMAGQLRRKQPQAAAEALQRERQKALRAPLIVVVAAVCNAAAKIPPIEQILAAGAAAQNMMLAATALGFGAMWKTGDAAYDDTVKLALGLETRDSIVGFLYLGTAPADAVPPPVRGQWEDRVSYWGEEGLKA